MSRVSPFLLLAIAALPLAAQTPEGPRTWRGGPTRPSITAADLKTRLYIVADDSMLGRETATLGNVKGTNYIAAQFKAMGLTPAGDSGGFFQTVPMKEKKAGGSFLAGTTALAFGKDFAVMPSFGAMLPYGGSLDADKTEVIFGGRLGDSVLVAPELAAGKLVVLLPPKNPDGTPNWRFWAGKGLRNYATSRGLIVVALDAFPKGFVGQLTQPQISYDDGKPAEAAGQFVMLATDAAADAILGAPVASAAVGQAGVPLTGHAGFDERVPAFPSRNVVAILRGSSPKLRGEYVAIGAHNDHVGLAGTPVDHDSLRAFNTVVRPRGAEDGGKQATDADWPKIHAILDSLRKLRPARPDSVFNGADDDGSGTVTLLEVAEAFAKAKVRPARSILFVSHVAEEEGLFGSHHFTEHPTVPRDSIVAQLNIDMVGRGGVGDEAKGGPGYVQLIGSKRLSTELGALVETRNTAGKHGLVFDYTYDAAGHPDQYYCRSDHYEYARWGIPIVFFSTGGHRDYHQLTDEPQYIDFAHMARIANFIFDVGGTVANLDHRPVVDGAKMDPYGECKQ